MIRDAGCGVRDEQCLLRVVVTGGTPPSLRREPKFSWSGGAELTHDVTAVRFTVFN